MTNLESSAEPLWTEEELATYAKVAEVTVRKWRTSGEGPAFIRYGKRNVRYRPADVHEWESRRRFRHLADERMARQDVR